jgi:hypothetical protein
LSERRFALSHFRLAFLKQRLAADQLVAFEQKFFGLAGTFPLAPSVFSVLRSDQNREARFVDPEPGLVAPLFRCPECSTEKLEQIADNLIACPTCHRKYRRHNQIWDFKEPV